jgi:hypothetical protein
MKMIALLLNLAVFSAILYDTLIGNEELPAKWHCAGYLAIYLGFLASAAGSLCFQKDILLRRRSRMLCLMVPAVIMAYNVKDLGCLADAPLALAMIAVPSALSWVALFTPDPLPGAART